MEMKRNPVIAWCFFREVTQLNVVLNWFEELKRLVPTN